MQEKDNSDVYALGVYRLSFYPVYKDMWILLILFCAGVSGDADPQSIEQLASWMLEHPLAEEQEVIVYSSATVDNDLETPVESEVIVHNRSTTPVSPDNVEREDAVEG